MADPLDVLAGRRRGASALRNTLSDASAVDPGVIDQVDAYNLEVQSPVARGAQAGAYGMTAGSFADEALDARLAGDAQQAQYLEQQAAGYAQQAALDAPRVRSLRDVGSIGDFGELVGGHLGQAGATMAPVLAGALLTRGRAMPRVTSFAGAAVPAYQLEQGEAILSQQLDPELAGMDPQRRAELARNKALANAALESIVPAGLVGTLGRAGVSPLRTVGRSMLEEGLTETAQEATGILAEETLRRGSLEQAMPALGEDPMRLVDAGFAGAVGGGGLSLPTAGSQALANGLQAAADRTVETGAQALEAGKDVLDKAPKPQDLREWADEALKGFAPEDLSDEDAVGELNRRTGPGRVVPNDPTLSGVQRAVRSGDPAAVQAAMDQHEQAQPTLRAQAATSLLNDDQAPAQLRALAARVLDGTASTEDQAQLLGQATGYQAGRLSKYIAAKGIVALDETVKFGKEQLAQLRPKPAPEEGKKNAMETGEEPALTEALFNELKPEFRSNPEVRAKLPALIQLFRRLDGTEPSRETYEIMQRLAPAMDMFGDVAKVLPKELGSLFASANRAQREAASADSWLSQNLTPAFQAAEPGARAALGRLIDRSVATREEPDVREMALLTRAFGSKGAVRTMLRHYKLQAPFLKSVKPKVEDGEDVRMEEAAAQEAEDLEIEEGPLTQQEARQEAIGERERLAGVTFEFADPEGTRPFLAPRTRDSRRFGKRSELMMDVRRRNEQDRSQYSRLVSVEKFAKERELNDTQLAGYLQSYVDAHVKQSGQDAKRKQRAADSIRGGVELNEVQRKDLDAIKGREVEQDFANTLLEAAGYDPEQPLAEQPEVMQVLAKNLQVIRSEARDISGNTGRKAPDLYRAGREGVTRLKAIDTRDGDKKAVKDKEALAKTLFKVLRGPNRRPVELSAATLLKAARGTTQSTGENDDAFTKRLFSEALGDLTTSDPSITGLDIPDGLVLDIDSGLTLGRGEAGIDAERTQDRLIAAEEMIGAERRRLADLEERLEDALDDLNMRGADAEQREIVDDILAELSERAKVFRDATGMNAPTTLSKQKYEARYKAELAPAGLHKINQLLQQAKSKVNRGYDAKKIWKAAFVEVNQVVRDGAKSEALKLAAHAKLGAGNDAVKLLRNEYDTTIRSAREDLRNLRADASFGDTDRIDNVTQDLGPLGANDLPRTQLNETLSEKELSEARSFDDFGRQLHGKEDTFTVPEKKDLQGQARRAYESLGLRRARLGQSIAKAVIEYAEDKILPSSRNPVTFAAQMKAVQKFIAANRAERLRLQKMWTRLGGMDTSTFAKQLTEDMINDARARRSAARELARTEAAKREEAEQFIAQIRERNEDPDVIDAIAAFGGMRPDKETSAPSPAPQPTESDKRFAGQRTKNNAQATDIHRELGRKGFAATHDSPHRFDGQFDWRKHAFKGEGAMAFGAGTYLSTSDGVHKHYKEKFTAQVGGGDPNDVLDTMRSLESETKKLENLKSQFEALGSPEKAHVLSLFEYKPEQNSWKHHYKVVKEEDLAGAIVENLKRLKAAGLEWDPMMKTRSRPYEESIFYTEDNIAHLQEELEAAMSGQVSPTYQVSVEANDGDILDWDASFDEQHPEVQEKLAEIAEVAPVEGTDVELGANRKFTIGTAVVGRVQKTALGNWGLYTSDRFAPISQAPTSMDAEEAAQYFWEEFQEGKHDKYLQAFMTPTGESIYRALQDKLGSQEKASDFLQAAGIVGHKFAASGGNNDRFPNYVIYDDSKITTNAVSFNKQTRKKSGIGISRELKNEIAAEIKRITGVEKVRKHLFFVKASEIGGASGQYTPAQRAIKVAISSVDPMGVAYHEALHDFIAGLQDSEEGRKLRTSLFKAGEMPHVRAQLKELLKDHPGALAAVESDAEERIAYMFQFWAVGKHLGKEIFKVRSPEAENAFGKLARWIRGLLGVVSQDEKAEAVLEALYEGKFADRNIVAAVIQDMKLDTLEDKLRRVAGPLADVYDKLMLVATDRLRAFGVEPLDELADMFATEPGREKGGLRFLQRRSQVSAQYLNRVSALFEKATAAERATALRNLQSMKTPSSPLEREVRKLLDELYGYMDDAGVKRFDAKTKEWIDLPKLKDYFPRHWDARKIMNNEAKFKALLQQHGNVSLDQQNKIIAAVTHGTGQLDLADSEFHVGYTPMMEAVQDRQLTFINATNAAEFAEFQNGDLADILTSYIFQAVHRAEFARDFGNAGEAIQERLDEAAGKLSGKELAEASNAIKGLVGTLGADMNPRLKDLYSVAITAQNVILLPLTMFSQFIDALGVGLRAQAPEEAWNAFKRGMKDFSKAVARRKIDQHDYDEEMAKTLGLIDEQNMLESMGQAHAGAFMSQGARKINQRFFRWNGMEVWNRSMRISAMVAGERFIQRELGNDRYMRELDLDKSDVMVKPDGRLAVTAEQMVALGATKAQAKAREQKIQQALFRFVDGAVLRPNAAQRPVWASDPHWMLIFHLKQFAFSFQKTILARVNNEFEHGKMMPAAILAAYVPVTMASGLAKAALTGKPIGDGSMMDLLNYGVMRSGILGSGSFGADAFSDLERGLLPGTSLIGPTMEHAWLASRFVVGDEAIDAGRVIDRSVPFARYF